MHHIMRALYLLFFLLNYFWLSWDPKKSASYYCDQHVYKIGSEVIESVWDAVLELAPELGEKATKKGLNLTYRHRRHSKPGMMWHPLSVWHCLSKANLKRGLINADEIFREHQRRTGTKHSAWRDCKFLLKRLEKIDFTSKRWSTFYKSQSGKCAPSKTKPIDVKRRIELFETYEWQAALSIDRNDADLDFLTPPQCMNDADVAFHGCRVIGDTLAGYRNYYTAKGSTVSGGMRYYHTTPPSWLECKVKIAKNQWYMKGLKLDDEGYVVVIFD